jgi:hypothetical protein
VIIYRNYSRFYQVSFRNCVTFVYTQNPCSFTATLADFTGLLPLVKEDIEQCIVSDLPAFVMPSLWLICTNGVVGCLMTCPSRTGPPLTGAQACMTTTIFRGQDSMLLNLSGAHGPGSPGIS